MKQFLKKICLFLGLFLLSAALVFALHFFVIGNQNLGSFQAALLDKTERLRSIGEPKIILIGNSNLAFGVDSQRIQEALGMPVVNMGLHGGLGNAFLENMVKLGVSEGDIVVVCHSDYDDDGTIPDPALAWITVEMHPEFWKLIPAKAIPQMLKAYPGYLYSSAVRFLTGSPKNVPETGTSYSRAGFNAFGDVCVRGEDSFVFTEGSVVVPQVGEETAARLNALNHYILSRGATMVVAGYPIGSGEFTPAEAEFDAFEAQLREALDCPVISRFADYFIPYSCFYDTVFHLNDVGVKLRTGQLIADLQDWMNR